jgi:peptidoglycan/LPS O-acetylase OafA/YrhL
MKSRDGYYDFIRAFAILLVLLCHKGKMPGGSIGVSIFFCLSGFLITDLLLRVPTHAPSNILRFVLRRLLRIYPLYVCALLAATILAWGFAPDRLPNIVNGLPALLTFTGLPLHSGYAIAVTWSLHVEFWFYLLFPVVFFITYSRGLLPLALAGLFCLSFTAKYFDGGSPATWPIHISLWQSIIYLDQLLYGSVCALLISRKSAVLNAFRSPAWLWASFLISLAIAKAGNLAHWHLEMSGAAVLCAIAILHHANHDRTQIRDNPILWMGRASFSIYLVHAIVLDYLPYERLPNILDTPSFFVVTLTLCYLTERIIERPSIRLSHEFGKFRRESAENLNVV